MYTLVSISDHALRIILFHVTPHLPLLPLPGAKPDHQAADPDGKVKGCMYMHVYDCKIYTYMITFEGELLIPNDGIQICICCTHL